MISAHIYPHAVLGSTMQLGKYLIIGASDSTLTRRSNGSRGGRFMKTPCLGSFKNLFQQDTSIKIKGTKRDTTAHVFRSP